MSGDRSLAWCLQQLFSESQVDSGMVESLLQIGDEEGGRGRQQGFMGRVYEGMQNRLRKQNTKMFIKRFLHIVSELLKRDEQKSAQKQYKQAISKKIVQYFITLLTIILKYSMNDLILDIKVVRKKWAKRITDAAFFQLKEQAHSKFRFDVDKGITQEALKKIRAQYEKRKFTPDDIEKYLGDKPLKPKELPNEEEPKPRKIVKKDSDNEDSQSQNQDVREPPLNDMMPPHSSYFPSHPNTYPLNQPYYPYPYQNRVNPNVNGTYYPVGTHSFYPNYPHQNPYPYQEPYQQQQYFPQNPSYKQSNKSNGYYLPVTDEKSRKTNQIYDLIHNLKFSSLYECRVCGLNLPTQLQNKSHSEKHFVDAQKSFEVSHSRRDHLRKEKLPTVEEWIEEDNRRGSEQYIVPISSVSSRAKFCFVCKDRLKVVWSDALDEWIFVESVKAKFPEHERMRVCHFQCYKIFEENNG